MRLYSLTVEEAAAVNAINYTRTNSLLIVCCHGEYMGVDPDALQTEEFAVFATLLGGYQESKVVEVEDVNPFGI